MIAVLPVCTQAQQQSNVPKPTKADAQRVVQIIGGNTEKVKRYCELAVVNDQIEQAVKRKDAKKVAELTNKAYEIARTMTEYLALLIRLDRLDPSSKEVQEILSVLETLDKLCDKK